MPIPATNHFDLWLGPAPARPYHETYFPGPRWYRWWDVGNGTMSDLGSHDNDVPYTVLDIKQPLTIEATSPNGPAHRELAPATMTVTYEFPASPGGAPRSSWYGIRATANRQAGCRRGAADRTVHRRQGHVARQRQAAARGNLQGLRGPPATLPRSPGHWVEWVNYAKGSGRCRARIFSTRAGRPKRTIWQRGLPDREEDRVGLPEPARPQCARNRHRSSRDPSTARDGATS
jgi:predicted dehydrogenase